MSKPFHNPFEGLANLTGIQPRQPQPAETSDQTIEKTKPEPGVKPVARAVVRIERSGRGGKEVTVVEHLDLSPAEREVWLKALKSGLGCGGVIEGASLVLQGDHRKRLASLLTKRGVKKVTVA